MEAVELVNFNKHKFKFSDFTHCENNCNSTSVTILLRGIEEFSFQWTSNSFLGIEHSHSTRCSLPHSYKVSNRILMKSIFLKYGITGTELSHQFYHENSFLVYGTGSYNYTPSTSWFEKTVILLHGSIIVKESYHELDGVHLNPGSCCLLQSSVGNYILPATENSLAIYVITDSIPLVCQQHTISEHEKISLTSYLDPITLIALDDILSYFFFGLLLDYPVTFQVLHHTPLEAIIPDLIKKELSNLIAYNLQVYVETPSSNELANFLWMTVNAFFGFLINDSDEAGKYQNSSNHEISIQTVFNTLCHAYAKLVSCEFPLGVLKIHVEDLAEQCGVYTMTDSELTTEAIDMQLPMVSHDCHIPGYYSFAQLFDSRRCIIGPAKLVNHSKPGNVSFFNNGFLVRDGFCFQKFDQVLFDYGDTYFTEFPPFDFTNTTESLRDTISKNIADQKGLICSKAESVIVSQLEIFYSKFNLKRQYDVELFVQMIQYPNKNDYE